MKIRDSALGLTPPALHAIYWRGLTVMAGKRVDVNALNCMMNLSEYIPHFFIDFYGLF
jgi:hypothetical protein